MGAGSEVAGAPTGARVGGASGSVVEPALVLDQVLVLVLVLFQTSA